MNQAWKKLADRINHFSLRERGIIFIMIVVVILALLNSVLLDPLSNKEDSLSQQLLQMEGEMQSLKMDTQELLMARTVDPNAAMQSRLAAINEQLAEINSLLQGKQQQLISPHKIAQMLEAILIQNRSLQLVTLSNLPTVPLIENDELADQTDSLVLIQSEVEAQIFKHGVEITVQGEYFDLLGYLDVLEKLPSQMFWDHVSLNVNEYPSAILTLTVYTLSLDKTWLTV